MVFCRHAIRPGTYGPEYRENDSAKSSVQPSSLRERELVWEQDFFGGGMEDRSLRESFGGILDEGCGPLRYFISVARWFYMIVYRLLSREG